MEEPAESEKTVKTYRSVVLLLGCMGVFLGSIYAPWVGKERYRPIFYGYYFLWERPHLFSDSLAKGSSSLPHVDIYSVVLTLAAIIATAASLWIIGNLTVSLWPLIPHWFPKKTALLLVGICLVGGWDGWASYSAWQENLLEQKKTLCYAQTEKLRNQRLAWWDEYWNCMKQGPS